MIYNIGMANSTHATTVFERLRADILAGLLPPGRRLPVKGLMATYGVGQTPLREALNRLTAEGLVDCADQRGFAIPPIDAGELAELTRTRCWLEERALRESMATANEEWEEALLVAHHRLARTPRGPGGNEALWQTRHRAFHALLVSGCGSRWLIGFCEQLTDRHQRYRALAARRSLRRRDLESEHRAILDAVLRRDADAAVALLSEHYTRTAGIILEDAAMFAAP